MNAITRAVLEYELEEIQARHAQSIEQVERFREQLRKAEEARDEYVEQIGALKEDLARSERADARQEHLDALMRTFR